MGSILRKSRSENYRHPGCIASPVWPGQTFCIGCPAPAVGHWHPRFSLHTNPSRGTMHNLQHRFLAGLFVLVAAPLLSQQLNSNYARDPAQAIDQQYTDQIHKYTTDPSFLSPLVDYLPASKTVPTPAKVLGDVSGAPDMLPYAEDVYKYFRMLEAASPCVKVVTIGHYRRGPRDDCRGHCRPGAAGRRKGQRRASGQARRSAHDQARRRHRRASWSTSLTPCTTSPGPSTRRKRARPPR